MINSNEKVWQRVALLFPTIHFFAQQKMGHYQWVLSCKQVGEKWLCMIQSVILGEASGLRRSWAMCSAHSHHLPRPPPQEACSSPASAGGCVQRVQLWSKRIMLSYLSHPQIMRIVFSGSPAITTELVFKKTQFPNLNYTHFSKH